MLQIDARNHGDTVVVCSMDRLARNLDNLRRLMRDMSKRGVRIEKYYTDTAGFTDQVFALMHLLGFRFAPLDFKHEAPNVL